MDQTGGTASHNIREPVVRAAFARVLAELREDAGLTQAQVAERSGYEEKYISALERRKHTPTLTAVIQISDAIGVSAVETLKRVLELLPKFAHLNASSTDDFGFGRPRPPSQKR